uniref:Uncharacterized protein n=1 Tax=Rhizophora mucronata TaxID=61149 RepID=A0A2P2Q9K1_RHIMU
MELNLKPIQVLQLVQFSAIFILL